MSKVLQCPHLASNGLQRWCMNGRVMCDCNVCNCPDKSYIEITTSVATSTRDLED